MKDVLQALIDALNSNQKVALATVVNVQGASPAALGMKILVTADGRVTGNVGGGLLEQAIVRDSGNCLQSNASRLARYALREEGEDAVGTLCGGEVQVFIEVFMPKPGLLIIGGGHVGRPLAEMAGLLDYDVQVVDVRPERGQALDVNLIDVNTYIVIMTEDASSDEAVLRLVLPTPAPYVGMIGSRRKCQVLLSHLRADDYDGNLLAKIHAPIGLNLGGRQPAEVALAILAEIEMVRHHGNGVPRGLYYEERET